MNFEKPPVPPQEQEINEEIDAVDVAVDQPEQQVEDPEYSPEDSVGIARAAADATDVLEGAVSGERRMNTSFTNDGLRGVVETNVSNASVRGEFEGSDLKHIEITTSGDSGEEIPVAVDLRNPNNPRITMHGEPVSPSKVPEITEMINKVKASTEDKLETPVVENETEELGVVSEEDDNEKIAA